MNFLEKLLTRAFGWTYDGKAEVLVEINHVNTYESRAEILERTTTVNYSKYVLNIERPLVGHTTIDHSCQICRKPLKINVASKSSLMKIIKPSVIVAGVSIPLLIILAALYDRQASVGLSLIDIATILAFLLILLSVAILFFVLPKEYRDKGIYDVICEPTEVAGRRLLLHSINQSPNS